jgi:hypothetical protein
VLSGLLGRCPRKIGTGLSNRSRQSVNTLTTSSYLNFSNHSRSRQRYVIPVDIHLPHEPHLRKLLLSSQWSLICLALSQGSTLNMDQFCH